MRITADTNLLVRAIVGDDPEQEAAAQTLLREAEIVAIPSAALCELCWVLGRLYGFTKQEIGSVIEKIIDSASVVLDTPAVARGLAVLREGGDFADGVIAEDGMRLGGQVFASFDPDARRRLGALGLATLAPDAM